MPKNNGIAPSADSRVMYIDTRRVFAEMGCGDPDRAGELLVNSQNFVRDPFVWRSIPLSSGKAERKIKRIKESDYDARTD